MRVYLLHAPDDTTSLEHTYKAIQELYLEEKFEKVGPLFSFPVLLLWSDSNHNTDF